ncbi:FAD-binding oxidoreductase [Stygiolobus caldivivus]|uniref:FAD binding domain-containing protein n=1 Tax=Stygiolobus caldivivus TaxID=2824673 RepID=A0A8D5UA35_9CREN|nr:FAD-binding oxidoreductase [Stygiolobus caldivivus]BCU71633.1 FAD binding domain-containing protein [Stygiolobus caldivivus]
MTDDTIAERFKRTNVEYSTDLQERIVKSRDLTKFVKSLSIPDIVVYPKNEEDVIKIVEFALEEHVPIVPRGSGHGSVGGVIPLKGGILVDMTRMNKRIEEDEDTITLEAGSPINFPARVYPTLWKRVTIGGNFCGGSWGIGSYMYGINWDQVIEARMVNPLGSVVTLKGGDIKIAAHAEGTTGIVTSLKVLKKPGYREEARIYLFGRLKDAVRAITKVYEESPPLYHLLLRSPQMSRLTKHLGEFNKWQLLIVYFSESEPEEKDLPRQSYVNGKVLWENRDMFFAGVYLKHFNEMYYSTVHVELDRMEGIMEKFKDEYLEVEFANDRLAHIDIMSNRPINFTLDNPFSVDDIKINSRLRRDHLQKIINYKKRYDKEDLFNPGKVSLEVFQ